MVVLKYYKYPCIYFYLQEDYKSYVFNLIRNKESRYENDVNNKLKKL